MIRFGISHSIWCGVSNSRSAFSFCLIIQNLGTAKHDEPRMRLLPVVHRLQLTLRNKSGLEKGSAKHRCSEKEQRGDRGAKLELITRQSSNGQTVLRTPFTQRSHRVSMQLAPNLIARAPCCGGVAPYNCFIAVLAGRQTLFQGGFVQVRCPVKSGDHRRDCSELIARSNLHASEKILGVTKPFAETLKIHQR